MTFEIEVGGRTRTVTVESTDRPGRLRVGIDGRFHLVDAVRLGEFGLSLLMGAATKSEQGAATSRAEPSNRVTVFREQSQEKGTLAGPAGELVAAPCSELVAAPMSCELQLAPAGRNGELLVSLEGRTALVTVNGRRSGHGVDAGAHGHGDVAITAPMPGRVLRVLVAAGQEVSARQGVVVVEAMKMENELRAPRPGRVKQIDVAPGTSVEAGRVLAVIE